MKRIISIACILCILVGCQLTPTVPSQPVPSSAPTSVPATPAPTEETKEMQVQEPAQSAENQETEETSGIKTEAPAEDNKTVTVYVTKTGHKYHRGNCQYLKYSKIPVTLDAAKQSYELCSVCSPPQ